MAWNLILIKLLSRFFSLYFYTKHKLKNGYSLKFLNEEQFNEQFKKSEEQFCCVIRNYSPPTIVLCCKKINKFDIRNLCELYYFIGWPIVHEIFHLVYKNKKFKNEKEEEFFIIDRIKEQYPKYDKIYHEIYLDRAYK